MDSARFKFFGLDAHIEQFEVLYPTPKTRVLSWWRRFAGREARGTTRRGRFDVEF